MASGDTVRSTWNITSSVPKAPDVFIAGVELEIEDVRQCSDYGGFNVTEDGSLRNNGKEFISPPLKVKELVDGFKKIHANLVHSKSKPQPFSDRTSIHVHINCLDLNQEQVKSIVLWYALFEPVFFAMCAPNRKNNIHCVPLDQTTLCENYRRTLPLFVQKWSKYTALNLLPLSTQGTIEFRHMEGHKDAEKFEAWLKTLENLWAYGKSNILNKGFLNKPNAILDAFDVIFRDAWIKNIRASVPALVADSLIDIKLALL